MYFLRCHCKISQSRGRVEAKKRLPVQMIFANADSRNGLYCTTVDHQLTTGNDFCCWWSVFIVDSLFYITRDRCGRAVQNQQKIAVYHQITRRVAVLRRQVPGVRIPSGAPRACDIKNATGSFLCCIAQNQKSRSPIFQVRFIEMSNHFKSVGLFCWAAWCAFSRPCRPVLQFFSGIFNFFLLFSECLPFPRSQFPIGCGVFSFFCSCRQNGTCTHFHSFPHYANVWRVLKSDIFYAKIANF